MPDWRKPEDYAYTEQLTLHGWAWEFLRRDAAFRDAWDRYRIAVQASRTPPTSGAAVPNFKKAFADATIQFGLWHPCDPALTALDAEVTWRSAAGVSILLEWDHVEDDDLPWPGYPTEIALSFDFRQPLGPQLEHANSILRGCEKRLTDEAILPGMLRLTRPKGRARPDRYPLYVRLLDAKLAGATIYRMGKELGVSWNDAKRTLKVAEAMASEGYKELVLRSPFHTPR